MQVLFSIFEMLQDKVNSLYLNNPSFNYYCYEKKHLKNNYLMFQKILLNIIYIKILPNYR